MNVTGSLNLRERAVTAIDIRKSLNLEPRPMEEKSMSVVVGHGEELYSLIIDCVGEALSPEENLYESNPATLDRR